MHAFIRSDKTRKAIYHKGANNSISVFSLIPSPLNFKCFLHPHVVLFSILFRVKASPPALMFIMRSAAKSKQKPVFLSSCFSCKLSTHVGNEWICVFFHVGKDAAAVVVRAQVSRGVAGGARRAVSDAGAAASSGNVHGAENASGRDPAARIVVDVFVDAKTPCKLTPKCSI